MKKEKKINVILYIALAMYIGMIIFIYFVISKNRAVADIVNEEGLFSDKLINIIPFKNIVNYVSSIFDNRINLTIVLHNLLMPVIVWIPSGILGFILGCKYKLFIHMLMIIILTAVIFSLRIILLIGYFDVDKIILSIFAYFVGFGIAGACSRRFAKNTKKLCS